MTHDTKVRTKKIFVASTIRDLLPFRQAAALAIAAVGMEADVLEPLTDLSDEQVVEICKSRVNDADACILVVSSSRGSTPRLAGLEDSSFTSLEYETAKKARIPIFIFHTAEPQSKLAADPWVSEWRRKHRETYVLHEVDNPDDLRSKIAQALSDWQKTANDRVDGWRHRSSADLRTLLENSTKLSVNLWDRLFGKRVELELPSSSGRTVRRQVTGRRLQSMEAAGKISPVQPTERAQRLIGAVEAGVTASALDLVDADSPPQWVFSRLDVWRLCLTAASIGLATTRERDSAGMVDAVDRLLREENPLLREAVADFLTFMFKRDERIPKDLIPAHIGLWVLWNVKGTKDAPDGDDILAVAKVGHFCLRMGSIWETAPILSATGGSP